MCGFGEDLNCQQIKAVSFENNMAHTTNLKLEGPSSIIRT